MGNSSSTGGNGRRRHGSRRNHPPPTPPQQEISANRYVFAAVTPYPAQQYPNNNNPNLPPPYYQYQGYYPPPPPSMPVPLPAPYDHHHRGGGPVESGHWRYPCGPMASAPPPYVEHQKAVTIRNDVNLKKETLRLEPDEENPGRFLVSFTFDATVAGRRTELLKEGNMDVYPLAVKAEAAPANQNGSDGNSIPGPTNSQITQAVFEKEKGEYQVRVVKQILWVNGMRYELQEIYGIGNSVEGDVDANDPGKECVICLSEPRDTTVLPCRHMCMCSGCAKVLRFQTNRCPICRQPVERLLEIKVNGPEE
ncbi:hypothetical protein Patl1_32080 [Pistacia atlantica]|uniref:Uncharacterized protein n=1 Tax=Pistacia atlantica TaxID=434234 RepID=A0ACC1AS11_9ROSI|nr:hypothetical protein Patl1_32080 [Pistacia atlantica]